MPLFAGVTLLMAVLPLGVSELLQEPDYSVVRQGDRWAVRKPGVGAGRPFTISHHSDRSAAELRRRSLPRLRLSGFFVRFDPVTFERVIIADWTAQQDAQDIAADIREIFHRFAPTGAEALLQSTPIYMARLFGATGHTAEESSDSGRFVIYLDPFRATGRLHAAATLIHELAHLQRYQVRGFHANRAAAVLSKSDFVLLGLADEFAAYEAEANLVRSFLADRSNEVEFRAIRDAITNRALSWPIALSVILGLEGPADEALRIAEARRQVVLDLADNAGRYWDARHKDTLDVKLRQMIQGWSKTSRDWKEIKAKRSEWLRAEDLAGQQTR
jgi:hypothetical protein